MRWGGHALQVIQRPRRQFEHVEHVKAGLRSLASFSRTQHEDKSFAETPCNLSNSLSVRLCHFFTTDPTLNENKLRFFFWRRQVSAGEPLPLCNFTAEPLAGGHLSSASIRLLLLHLLFHNVP